MENLANSRKLNGISLVECLQNDVTDKENQLFPALVRSPKIDQSFVKKYQQPNSGNNYADNNPVSKSLKSFFNKLRGSSAISNNTAAAAVEAAADDIITEDHANTILNNNQASLHLLKPTTPPSTTAKHTKNTAILKEKRILIPSSYSTNKSYSKYPNNYHYNKASLPRPKKKKIMMISPVSSSTATKKNYHLPTIITSNTKSTTLSNHEQHQQQQQQYRRRISLSSSNSYSSFRIKRYQHRHTLDLSCYTPPNTPGNAAKTTDNAFDTNDNITKNDSKIELSPSSTKKRANSVSCNNNNNNTSSIYSTFTSSASSTASSASNNKASTTTTSSSSSCSITSCSSSSFGLKRVNNTVQNITELLSTTKEETEDDTNDFFLQKRLWNEDITLCQREEIAQWLGSKPAVRSRILYLYMSNFDFSNKRLDEAFRILCSKLYLKGESQQLDRIIEAFAKRYFECNPTSLLHCVDVVYAVAYSLLLLNTDLHVADTAEKMTKNKFIKNTMDTIQMLIFPHLKGDEATEFLQQRKRRTSILSHQSNSNDSLMSTCSSSGSGASPTLPFPAEDNHTVVNKLDALKSNISWKTTSSSPNNNYDSGGNGLTRTQKMWLADIESLLKDMYTAVKSHSIDQAATAKTSSPSTAANPQNTFVTTANGGGLYRSRTLPKKTTTANNDALTISRRRRRGHSAVIVNSTTSKTNNTTSIKKNLQLQQALLSSLSINSTDNNSSNNFKEGLVMRKHVMESAEKRARNRQWQLCYLEMNETNLVMYKPTHVSETLQQEDQKGSNNAKTRRRRRKSILLWSQSICSLQDILSKGIAEMEDWKADKEQTPLDTIEMNHTYAIAIPPPGWNGQRPHVFRLETADGGLWLFESIDMIAIQVWVEAANLTASKISKGPLTGAVCNIDYGWGSQWDNKNNGRDDTNISSSMPIWYPPTPCMVNSTLSVKDQYRDLESQIASLNQQLNDHRQLKLSLDKKFNTNTCPYGGSNGNTLNSMQALTNWDRKLHYILHELIKLNCYKDSIHKQLLPCK